jgi:acyl-CoA synthetase
MKSEPLATLIDRHARRMPEAVAFYSADDTLTWRDYAARSDRLAALLAQTGLAPGERVAVLLPDGPGIHVAFVACEKAGLVAVGIGPRAGLAEILHLTRRTGAAALLSRRTHRELETPALAKTLRDEGQTLLHLVCEGELELDSPIEVDGKPNAARPEDARALASRRIQPANPFLLNSTSGTTGLPKCVIHHLERWLHFHRLAVEAADLSQQDIFLSALPAPFGFGIWTAHTTPTLLGAPCVLMPRFDADLLAAEIERHRVSVMAAVSTQFIMMLDAPSLARRDLRSLRVLFTGGEAVPYHRATTFEEETGAAVLQFYGSNETGALSRTTLRDSRDIRLRSAGHVIDEMQVRLFDDEGRDVTAEGRGQPACRGPLLSQGYYDDPAANRKLYTDDGWMLTGDIATLDAEGVLSIVGRTADFIIRGGKNLSGAVVEDAVSAHPAVALAAAIAMPDPVYGERVCAYVELREGESLTLEELVSFLRAEDVSVEYLPEHLVVLPELPRASGGKVAKQALREDIKRRAGEPGAATQEEPAR